jgi:hypothetical protein
MVPVSVCTSSSHVCKGFKLHRGILEKKGNASLVEKIGRNNNNDDDSDTVGGDLTTTAAAVCDVIQYLQDHLDRVDGFLSCFDIERPAAF